MKKKGKSEELKEIKITDDDLCAVCLQKEKFIILKPCGHVCTCLRCSIDMLKLKLECPMCRGKVEDVEHFTIERDSEITIEQEKMILT